MSIATIVIIKERILAATESSKIAVFKVFNENGIGFDAVFDNTVKTQDRIKSGDYDYVGSFYGKNGWSEFAEAAFLK